MTYLFQKVIAGGIVLDFIGDYRILFELEGNSIKVYRIRHRKNVYK
jgi:hypothetical protein